MKKRFALALVAASLVAAGCSSDDDGDDPDTTGTTTGATTGTGTTDGTDTGGAGTTGGDTGGGGTTTGTTGGDTTVTDGPDVDAGPVELAVAADENSTSFYTLFDAIFGGETFDERRTPGEAWTVFVPTDAAFAAAGAGETPDDERQLLLQRHVVVGNKLTTTDIAGMSEIVVNSTDSYPVTGDSTNVAIDGASLTRVIAENELTIVYSIDGFLE